MPERPGGRPVAPWNRSVPPATLAGAMSEEERRTVVVTTIVLLLASLLRFGWESRPMPPVLPPEEIPEELVEATRQEVEREARMRTPLEPGERVDPNRDPDVELARLPGVGPALAGRILESRDAEGPFRTAGDLLRVPGIGPATLERITPLLDLDDPPAGAFPVPGGAGGAPQPGGSSQRVNVNRAAAAELETLPGSGPALADRILEHRARFGPFRTVDDLLEVPGIGPATLDRLRPIVSAGL